ncbi:MAG: isoprenylcysteine carboxylmethyltransferase family protein [Anaerolineales bacterium]|nr:isoprenylcysteine carboxylmethyltransferase family protein [Anaerolineales bacterium]
MLTALRHLLSILILPFVVVVIVPGWLLAAFAAIDPRWGDGSLLGWIARILGMMLLIPGLTLFAWCVSLFIRIGQGTLAPWDPTQKLVAVGPYQYVRNPMISAVALLLISQALFWGSGVIAVWAGVFILVNHVYFVLSEEPGLEARFGASYRMYKANVPRWLPRRKPWSGE